jgi:predicted nucleic acid-binding protein
VLYVIDAGVVVKWFIPEVDSAQAHQLLERYLQGMDTPVAPDLLSAECGNVFRRRCRQGDITPDEATENSADLLTLQVPTGTSNEPCPSWLATGFTASADSV